MEDDGATYDAKVLHNDSEKFFDHTVGETEHIAFISILWCLQL